MEPSTLITPDFTNAIGNSPWLVALLASYYIFYKIILAVLGKDKQEK